MTNSDNLTPLAKLPGFDPRRVPAVEEVMALPPVPAERLTPEALRQRFATPPVWQPEVRAEPRFVKRVPTPAAVLMPLVVRPEHPDTPMLLLTQRTSQLRNHSGQIALPGGKVDAGDADATATALREAEEEVGLPHDHVEVLGSLFQYTTGTAFVITPVVALVRPGFTLRPNAEEVADVFEVPLSFVLNPANHRRHVQMYEGLRREWFSMPYMDKALSQTNGEGVERFIWGATAGMLRNFYRFMSA